ncbi:MAG: phosphoenolpyruvate--protein phosphotransferase [Candidatus Dormibacteria bacterium]
MAASEQVPIAATPGLVALVLVSHSAQVAEGTAELARAMAHSVRIVPAGGMGPPEAGLGTDAQKIARAIGEVWSPAGVLVLIDLGSALLSAEIAKEMMAPDRRDSVLLSGAALVEGAVAAAVAAQIGEPLDRVAAAAMAGLQGKEQHLGPEEPEQTGEAPAQPLGDWLETVLELAIPLGLHARPAARLIQKVAPFDAEVEMMNATTGRGPVSGRSLNGLASLQVRSGQRLMVRARGQQARALLRAASELSAQRFGEPASGSLAAGPLPPPPPPPPGFPVDHLPSGALPGLPASPGVAHGVVVHLIQSPLELPDDQPQAPEVELARLDRALTVVRGDLVSLRELTRRRAGDYEADIIDAQTLFLQDPALVGKARALIASGETGAARAWGQAAAQARQSWDQIEMEDLKLRALDLEGVSRRVLAHLLGAPVARPSGVGVLVADELTPTDTAGLDPATVLGIATAGDGPTSHSAILARSLGIPAVVGLGPAALALLPGTEVLLDGDQGVLLPNPPVSLVESAQQRQVRLESVRTAAGRAALQPARTADGVTIEVAANIASVADARLAVALGADGVGLLRTEFLFQDEAEMPDAAAQEAIYREIAEILAGRPLTIRTLDVGADKPLRYLPRPGEANPALGVRGIRLGLQRRELLLSQLAAIWSVARSHPVRVMFPMVATRAEIEEVRVLLAQAGREGGSSSPSRLEVGIMVEIPAAAVAAELLAPLVDFMSVGTNDLSQYTMAADRTNSDVAQLADPLHPAVLRLIRQTAQAGVASGGWVGVCGELAGDAAAAPLLVGLGVRELSMAASRVATVKAAVRRVDTAAAQQLAEQALVLPGAGEVRRLLAGRGSATG